ncbi:MAG TPA: hypothetical protein VFE16_01255 [Candidatus Cybelea sp.]|nr:hypothetical protein [Candidatus Cybelea sp.]
MTPADRELIGELLQDPERSYRSIARETGYSDWTIRKIARELDGDPRPLKRERSPPPDQNGDESAIAGWIGLAAFVAIIGLTIWVGLRGIPPPEM